MSESILDILNVVAYVAMILSFALMIFITYHREQEPYLYPSLISVLIYHILLFLLSNPLAILSLSSVGLIIIWKLIKAYSTKINKEYKEHLLKNLYSFSRNVKFSPEELKKYEQERLKQHKKRLFEIEKLRIKREKNAEKLKSRLTEDAFQKWLEEQHKR